MHASFPSYHSIYHFTYQEKGWFVNADSLIKLSLKTLHSYLNHFLINDNKFKRFETFAEWSKAYMHCYEQEIWLFQGTGNLESQ